ncbi:hypothetical protein ACH5RR_019955 [Cinchona calisaya]|uniref:Uncharacterized protein n=1 Tax=Cinchona calisaya TaxID=153742 RepID=A0ABD2ZD32_9GENT
MQSNPENLKQVGDAVSAQQDTNWLEMEDHREDDVDHSLAGIQPATLPQLNWVQNNHFQHSTVTTPALHIHDHVQLCNPQLPLETTKKLPKDKTHTFSLATLELLSNYSKGLKNIARQENSISNTTDDIPPSNYQTQSSRKLSLAEIMRLAGERYIQFSTQRIDGVSALIHPYGSAVADLSLAETADVELLQLLLIAAECVGHRQFDVASSLITRCRWIASDSGNPAQRIVFYFAEALQNRIDIETGRTTPEKITEQFSYARNLQLDSNLSFLACHQALPFSQVEQFASMQTIIDNLKSATKIHLIDLHIRSGVQWTVLIQALAEHDDRPELLKITAVGTTNKQHIEETGKRLISFAQTLNFSLSFNVVMVSDMKELKLDMFGRAPDEAVAVYSPLILRTMISKADSLGNAIKVIRRLKPAIVVVVEVEANHNSPLFISRFTESLFFYSAFFDCLEDCMERDNEHRKIIEGIYFGEGIRNMIGNEGDKRCTRNVMIDVWREFFARYGMAEVELSDSSLRQANMILNKFPKASSCNLTNTGKGIVIEWKGTPIHSLTTWKFM